jgi:hypothetical protein
VTSGADSHKKILDQIRFDTHSAKNRLTENASIVFDFIRY